MQPRRPDTSEGTVNHVSLDDQPSAVRDFILALAAEPAGTVVEVGGRPVACLVPPPRGANGTPAVGWAPELDRRRCVLIDRDIAGAITPAARREGDDGRRGGESVTAPFDYPPASHARKHGPRGYAGYESCRPWLRDEFQFRCVYCLRREQWGRVTGEFAIDHFLPSAHHPGRAAEYDNLLYACAACNLAKGDAELPDPLATLVATAVAVGEDGAVAAATDDATRLVRRLRLDRASATEFRALWVAIVRLAAAHDPVLLKRLMGYPDDLPDLSPLDPPGGNSRPEGIAASCLARKRAGTLAETY